MSAASGHGSKHTYGFVAMVVVVTLLDQITKWMILQEFVPGQLLPIIPGLFNLTLTYNPGAAFGIMADWEGAWRIIGLGVTTVLALAAITYFFLVEYRNDLWARYALMSIVGGALGNVVDRVRLGKVVDFLDFYLGSYHWPAFNVADSAICLGVAVLILRGFRKQEQALTETA